MRDQHRDELDEKRYFMETQRYRDWVFPPAIVQQYWNEVPVRTWRDRVVDLAPVLQQRREEIREEAYARLLAAVSPEPKDYSAAEAAVGYSLA